MMNIHVITTGATPLPMSTYERQVVASDRALGAGHYVVVRHVRYNAEDELMCCDRVTYALKSSPIGKLVSRTRPMVIIAEACHDSESPTTEAYLYWEDDR